MLKELKELVYQAILDLVGHGLVILTFGNASAFDRGAGLMAIIADVSERKRAEKEAEDKTARLILRQKIVGVLIKKARLKAGKSLRETAEEIGVNQLKVEVLGELDDMATAGTNYVISPYVALIPYPYDFKVDEFETEEIIEVPLAALLDEKCMREGTALVDGQSIDSYFYHYGKKIIWGATARILKQFLEIVSDVMAEGGSLEAK